MVELQADWEDFDIYRSQVANLTVDKLKQLIVRLNDDCNENLLRTGKKAELITRIQGAMDAWRRSHSSGTFRQARDVIDEVQSQSAGSSSRRTAQPYLPSPAASVPGPPPVPYHQYPATNSYPAPPQAGSSTYPYSSRPVIQPSVYAPPSHAPLAHVKSDIRFSSSPFYRVVEPVSELAVTPEAKDPTERKSSSVSFNLTASQRERLSLPNTIYQLRLYCTSSTHYSSSAFGRVNPCPIEFPSTCEVRVNGTLLSANLRGLKKKPGTAPPADLGKTVRLAHSGPNKLDMIFMNNQTPFQPKKFYSIVNLVEVTSVQQIVDRIRTGKYRKCEDILAKMKAANAEDEDIVAGQASLSLKCPMSYIRINIPCRSKYCVHSQCFDAESWFSVMEQTTTWLCPVCEKTLQVDDLIVDGYFDNILQNTPESVDDVVLEADGEWHTSDSKYSSSGWKKKAAPSPRPASVVTQPEAKQPTSATQSSAAAEVFVIDSDDDEDEGRVKREISPSFHGNGRVVSRTNGSNGSGSTRSKPGDVIDLTLSDDDDDDDAGPVQSRPYKRPALRDSYSPPPLPAAKRPKPNGDSHRTDGTASGSSRGSGYNPW